MSESILSMTYGKSFIYFPCQIALIMNFMHRFVFYKTSGLTYLKLFFEKLFFTFALLSTSSLFHNETKIVDSTNLRFDPEIWVCLTQHLKSGRTSVRWHPQQYMGCIAAQYFNTAFLTPVQFFGANHFRTTWNKCVFCVGRVPSFSDFRCTVLLGFLQSTCFQAAMYRLFIFSRLLLYSSRWLILLLYFRS